MIWAAGRTLAFILALAGVLAGQGSDFIQGRVFDKETGDPCPPLSAFPGRIGAPRPGATAGSRSVWARPSRPPDRR